MNNNQPKSFKYYGSVSITNTKIILTLVICYLLYFIFLKFPNKTFFSLLAHFSYFLLIPSSIISNFLVSKYVKALPFSGLIIDISDDEIVVPKKYYWSNKNLTTIPLKGIIYLYRSTYVENKGIYINFRDKEGNYSSTTLEQDLFESADEMTKMFNLLIEELGFSLAEEGNNHYVSGAEVYVKP